MRSLLIALSFLITGTLYAQTNIIVTNAQADAVLKGNYNPAVLAPGTPVDHELISKFLQQSLSPDSLKKNIIRLAGFQNRNTGSDTVSSTKGIGAARRWVFNEFASYSQQSGGRLLPAYLQFDEVICSQPQHRNIMAVLPGSDTTDKSIIIIEGHIDSRNKDLCDTAGLAQGVEDNASGTALVMELARVMSYHSYKNTIVFTAVISEEQGLNGARAFATYCLNNKIPVKAVLNNDVIGGVICGKTSSPPSCPGENEIDSTQVRLFSAGSAFSDHKNLVRFIKLEYLEELKPYVTVPMQVTLMAAEDRTGRGGDHIPFREKGYTAMRFTSANEHGDASNSAGYQDRQHTEDDVLGVDTDGDAVIDSFFVDFNYLARNAAINGTAAAMAAIGPVRPSFELSPATDGKMRVSITDPNQYGVYRVGFRTGTTIEWDTLYTTTSQVDSFPVVSGKSYFVSVAAVDGDGVESLFASEKRLLVNGMEDETKPQTGIELLSNRPNPFDETTTIGFIVHNELTYKSASIQVTDLQGKLIKQLPVKIQKGLNEVSYEHGYNTTGTFIYQLVIDGRVIDSRKMIFTAN
ncbi:MAG: M28 family peptidase [Bacteroidota bacterium]